MIQVCDLTRLTCHRATTDAIAAHFLVSYLPYFPRQTRLIQRLSAFFDADL